ncbi:MULTISPECIES: thioredoxin domain-containing protein [Citrobacter]|uniref:hypothetical protein n=1 Tax=Citrobacter TaxID=544 RepID=UPI001900E5E9|nr:MULTISPECIES: hypothetical protein [Citrobacter]MBJ9134418.1 hypothetical protein [Citrobacter farmeri]MDM2738399.1 hypothetical protein [Citrobacter sp. Ct235]
MVRKTKLAKSLTETIEKTVVEIESQLIHEPVADTPSYIVFKDGKEVAVVEKVKIVKYFQQHAGISSHDLNRIIDRPCHINGWTVRTKE